MDIQEGTYQCRGIQFGYRILNNGNPVIQIEVYLGTKWDGKSFVKIVAENNDLPTFVGEVLPYKSDGSVSDFRWKNLQEVFGWAGDTLESLVAMDISKKMMQMTIGKNDKGYLCMEWLNKFGDTPKSGMKKIEKGNIAELKRFTARGPASQPLAFNGDIPPPMKEEDVPF